MFLFLVGLCMVSELFAATSGNFPMPESRWPGQRMPAGVTLVPGVHPDAAGGVIVRLEITISSKEERDIYINEFIRRLNAEKDRIIYQRYLNAIIILSRMKF